MPGVFGLVLFMAETTMRVSDKAENTPPTKFYFVKVELIYSHCQSLHRLACPKRFEETV
jgi:hypothetical protein